MATDAAAKNVKLSTRGVCARSMMSMIPARTFSHHQQMRFARQKQRLRRRRRAGTRQEAETKIWSAPQLSKRFESKSHPKPKPKRTSRSLDQASTDELLAELAKRSDDDDLAFAATEAAELARKELEEEEEDEDEEDEKVLCRCTGRTGNLPSGSSSWARVPVG